MKDYKKHQEYMCKIAQIQDLYERLDGVEYGSKKFEAKEGDLDLMRECLLKTEGIYEIIAKAEVAGS